MECSCACDVDYEAASFFSEKWRKARIAHICCECGEPISTFGDLMLPEGSRGEHFGAGSDH